MEMGRRVKGPVTRALSARYHGWVVGRRAVRRALLLVAASGLAAVQGFGAAVGMALPDLRHTVGVTSALLFLTLRFLAVPSLTSGVMALLPTLAIASIAYRGVEGLLLLVASLLGLSVAGWCWEAVSTSGRLRRALLIGAAILA